MGGLWVDYNLMSTIPGLFVLGEANFSDHGANRLGASALMQGLADGYFVLPVHDRQLPRRARSPANVDDDHAGVQARRRTTSPSARERLLAIKGKRTVDSLPPRARQAHVGRLRHGAQRSRACKHALAADPGAARGVLAERARARQRRGAEPVAREGRPRRRLPRARRADVPRRARSATSPAAATSARSTRPPTARRCATTSDFCHVAAWEYDGRPAERPRCTRSRSTFENVHLAQRSYK